MGGLTFSPNGRQVAGGSALASNEVVVLDAATGVVIGCVYIYPSKIGAYDVDVRSWVSAARAELDKPLHEVVSGWLAESWPFRNPDYAAR